MTCGIILIFEIFCSSNLGYFQAILGAKKIPAHVMWFYIHDLTIFFPSYTNMKKNDPPSMILWHEFPVVQWLVLVLVCVLFWKYKYICWFVISRTRKTLKGHFWIFMTHNARSRGCWDVFLHVGITRQKFGWVIYYKIKLPFRVSFPTLRWFEMAPNLSYKMFSHRNVIPHGKA